MIRRLSTRYLTALCAGVLAAVALITAANTGPEASADPAKVDSAVQEP
ncbi:hypothetical protein [Streptomyces cavernae]|nr:hypothetical protein [Streptomyces cavernae]